MSRFDRPTKRSTTFSWSYSKLKNFETCGYRHQQIDLLHAVAEPESIHLTTGNEAHEAMAKAVMGASLPTKYKHFQPWVDRLTSRGNDTIYVEQKLALTEAKGATTFFSNQAWFRGVVDYLKLVDTSRGTVGLAVDYKTGKRAEDLVQLALFAAMVFAHYPQVRKLRTEYIWLKEPFTTVEECTTSEILSPSDMGDLWVALSPRIEALKYAHDTNSYPPTPGRLCREYCPVSGCEYHGRPHR